MLNMPPENDELEESQESENTIYSANEEDFAFCGVCQQEYNGACPSNSADCPFVYGNPEKEEDSDEFEEKKEMSDFEDIDDIDSILDFDEEAERLIGEEEELPPEDLIYDEPDDETDEVTEQDFDENLEDED